MPIIEVIFIGFLSGSLSFIASYNITIFLNEECQRRRSMEDEMIRKIKNENEIKEFRLNKLKNRQMKRIIHNKYILEERNRFNKIDFKSISCPVSTKKISFSNTASLILIPTRNEIKYNSFDKLYYSNEDFIKFKQDRLLDSPDSFDLY